MCGRDWSSDVCSSDLGQLPLCTVGNYISCSGKDSCRQNSYSIISMQASAHGAPGGHLELMTDSADGIVQTMTLDQVLRVNLSKSHSFLKHGMLSNR